MTITGSDDYTLDPGNLNDGYSLSQILFGVSLKVERGKIVGLIGAKSSVKYIVLESIFGLITIYRSSIVFNGEAITGMKPHQIAKRGIVYLPQTENAYSQLTNLERTPRQYSVG